MFLKYHFSFGSATPFISVMQMFTSHAKSHVNFNKAKYAPTSGRYVPTCHMMMTNVVVLPKVKWYFKLCTPDQCQKSGFTI